jgi:Dihydrodipicolinate synthase/N-acetylneuraminate lyase
MQGTGVPLVTPFDEDGAVDEERLREVATWLVERGVDFLVPAGSNSESELLSVEERARVTEVVADEVSVPVLAGTGHPGPVETHEQTRRAAAAGADAALVVTPFYFDHDQTALADYYRDLAADIDLPVYLYSVPALTGTQLTPDTVGELAEVEGIAGMKDSAGDLTAFQRERRRTGADFDLLVGSGSVYAPALDAEADGGVLALANVVPELAAAVYERHRDGEHAAARDLNAALVDLNEAVTTEYGVPGVKAAMRYRDVPAGRPRSPHKPLYGTARETVEGLVKDALALV